MNEMSKIVRKYTEEFKSECVQYALKSDSIRDAATALGVPPGTLYAWFNKAKEAGVQVVADGIGIVNKCKC